MGVQVQDVKVELKGVVEQLYVQKVARNALKAEKKELTTKIKAAKQQVKNVKKAKEDTSTLKEELLVLKGQKQSKDAEISKMKAVIVELRKSKVVLRNRIKGIKTKD